MRFLFAAIIALMMIQPLDAQLFRFRQLKAQPAPLILQDPICNGPECQLPGQIIWQQPPSVAPPLPFLDHIPVESLPSTVEEAEMMLVGGPKSGPSSAAAVRVSTRGGCGSGSVCGYYREGSLVLTNAHVTGTRPGSTSTVRAVVNGQAKDMPGVVIMAAYSNRMLTDWAIVYVEGLTEIEPVKLAKTKPSGAHYTRGSPRCVWPLRDQAVQTVDIADNSSLWRWRPNSIGGQSGSGVYSVATNHQEGLLTWSWGGLGAGQQTSEIWRQAKERSNKGEQRIGGMVEVLNSGVVVENGFFAETGIDDLPIWVDDSNPSDPDVTDPIQPEPECEQPERERRLLKRLRDRAKERGVDYLKLIELILQILLLFSR